MFPLSQAEHVLILIRSQFYLPPSHCSAAMILLLNSVGDRQIVTDKILKVTCVLAKQRLRHPLSSW